MNLENKTGIIQLRDWWRAPNGCQFKAIGGTASVISAESILGFKIGAKDSNWGLTVKGEKTTAVVLGCQFMGFLESDLSAPICSEIYMVP